jgi:hypothetical protein
MGGSPFFVYGEPRVLGYFLCFVLFVLMRGLNYFFALMEFHFDENPK